MKKLFKNFLALIEYKYLISSPLNKIIIIKVVCT